jgi:hypothetical protein
LEGKVQREHFYKNIALRSAHTSTPNGAPSIPDEKPVLQKPGKSLGFSSVGLKMADG